MASASNLWRRMWCRVRGGHFIDGDVIESVGCLALLRCPGCGAPMLYNTFHGGHAVAERDVARLAAEIRGMRERRIVR